QCPFQFALSSICQNWTRSPHLENKPYPFLCNRFSSRAENLFFEKRLPVPWHEAPVYCIAQGCLRKKPLNTLSQLLQLSRKCIPGNYPLGNCGNQGPLPCY